MLITAAILYILSSANTTRKDQTIFFNRYILITLSYAIFIAYMSLINYINIGLYNNFYTISYLNTVFNIFIILLSLTILNLTSFYPLKIFDIKNKIYELYINRSGEIYKILEYPLIILFIIIGAIFLMNSNDVLSLFLSLELQSYGLYLLCTLFRNSELSTSSGLTYFLLGSLSSSFVLLGTGLLYSYSGMTNLDSYYLIYNIFDIKDVIENMLFFNTSTNYYLLIISVGLLFKISAAPFHFWSPDVYDGIPTITTTFVAIVTKISILLLMFELVNYTNNNMFDLSWTIGILISSLLSLIIGTVLGLNQSRIKRLLAYSTISHLGFLLLSLSINTIESIQAFIFYLIQYSFTNLNLFIIIITIGYIICIYTDKDKNKKKFVDINNSPLQLTNQIKGLFTLNPLISVSFAITIYSLIGVPPLLGFFGKQIVLSSALDQGYIFITLIAILTSVISAVYYLNIIKNIFFETSEYIMSLNKNINVNISKKLTKIYNNIYISANFSLWISILTIIITVFMFSPEEFINLTNILSDPSKSYIYAIFLLKNKIVIPQFILDFFLKNKDKIICALILISINFSMIYLYSLISGLNFSEIETSVKIFFALFNLLFGICLKSHFIHKGILDKIILVSLFLAGLFALFVKIMYQFLTSNFDISFIYIDYIFFYLLPLISLIEIESIVKYMNFMLGFPSGGNPSGGNPNGGGPSEEDLLEQYFKEHKEHQENKELKEKRKQYDKSLYKKKQEIGKEMAKEHEKLINEQEKLIKEQEKKT